MIFINRTYATVERRGPTHKRLGLRFEVLDRGRGISDELMVC